MDSEKKLTEIIAWLNDKNLRKEALELIALLSSADDLRAGKDRLKDSRFRRKVIRQDSDK